MYILQNDEDLNNNGARLSSRLNAKIEGIEHKSRLKIYISFPMLAQPYLFPYCTKGTARPESSKTLYRGCISGIPVTRHSINATM